MHYCARKLYRYSGAKTEPRENIARYLSLFEKIVQDFVFGCINVSRNFALVSFVNGWKLICIEEMYSFLFYYFRFEVN